jgi:hypothetical protein
MRPLIAALVLLAGIPAKGDFGVRKPSLVLQGSQSPLARKNLLHDSRSHSHFGVMVVSTLFAMLFACTADRAK